MLKISARMYCDHFSCKEYQTVNVDLEITSGKIEADIDHFPSGWDRDENKLYCPKHNRSLENQ